MSELEGHSRVPSASLATEKSGPGKVSGQAIVTQPGIPRAAPFQAWQEARVHGHVVWGLYLFPRAARTNEMA